MRSGVPINLIGQKLVYRAVAICLLLFAFVDIAAPELCGEKFASLFTVNELSSKAQSSNGSITPPSSNFHAEGCPENHSQPNPAHADDECFCCCSHVLPINIFSVTNAIDLKPLLTSLNHSFLPSSPPRSLFHPPRLF